MTDSPTGFEARVANCVLQTLVWARKPAPRWLFVLGLVGLLGAAIATRSDPALKRWSSETSRQTVRYANLVRPPMIAQRGEGSRLGPHSSPDWNKPHLSVYSVAAPPGSLAAIGAAGDSGRARAPDLSPKEPRDASSHPERSQAGDKDPFRFERVLVATVAKGADWSPGDRMMWTRVFVQPINFSLAGYSIAATENETVKVGSVESTRSRKVSADLDLTIPGLPGPKATISPSNEASVKSTSDIDVQYEKLGVDITPGFLRVIRESETGGDAVGNTTITLSAVTDASIIWRRLPKDRMRHVANGAGASRDGVGPTPDDEDLVLLVRSFNDEAVRSVPGAGPPKTTVSPIDVLPQIPVPHCALRARVWMLYEQRRIEGGDSKYYAEAQQKVSLLRDAESKSDLDIVSADEVSPAFWSLKMCNKERCANDGVNDQPLTATVSDVDRMRWVVFTDYAVAVKVAHWLRLTRLAKPPGSPYRFNYPDGSTDSLIPVRETGDTCKKGPPQGPSSEVALTGPPRSATPPGRLVQARRAP